MPAPRKPKRQPIRNLELKNARLKDGMETLSKGKDISRSKDVITDALGNVEFRLR